ncbi:hypothetical protein [Aequorivita echinoideorum]|uniref:STAS/SEC14 domain-containing protein n=1 Tax=Aequorivita echinoideorum TaxID=1549647 RepID=A0ABS5S6X0_9FLAO|nr:hypothetical protein [Aequorivita echinoideorum]MBT0608960.1 hypothetical protein [Aequorivita echinoideorum]
MKYLSPHNFPQQIPLNQILETDIGKLYFYENIVVMEVDEGVVLSYKNGFSILIQGLNILEGRPFVYISNRIHSYSIKLPDYKYLNKVPTLRGVAVVTYTEVASMNIMLEATFCKKPFRQFGTMADAYNWSRNLLGYKSEIV